MARIMFVDDRMGEIIRQWELSECEKDHIFLPMVQFGSIEETCQVVRKFAPDAIFIGFGLGKATITGADVIKALREDGFKGYIFANSGGSIEQFTRYGIEVDGNANRNHHDLNKIMNNLTKRS